MKKKRIYTDMFLSLSVLENGSAADLSTAQNLTLKVKRQDNTDTTISQTFTRVDNTLSFQWSSVENVKLGTFNVTIEYDKTNSNSETGSIHYAIDFISAFQIVPVSSQEEDVDTTLSGNIEAQGVDGMSAYEIAKKNGYTGTETEWLASLVPTLSIDGSNNLIATYNN